MNGNYVDRWICSLALLGVLGQARVGKAHQSPETLIKDVASHDVFLSPDFKFTEVDGRFANLAGLYGGWLIDRKLLLGGGAYFLTNRSDDFEMTYGGAVVEYFIRPNRLVHFSVKGLVGGGTATLSGRYFGPLRPDRFPPEIPANVESLGMEPPPGFRWNMFPDFPRSTIVDEAFFVVEPEANVLLNLTEHVRIGFGGGYRFVGATESLDARLDGLSANVTVKLSLW